MLNANLRWELRSVSSCSDVDSTLRHDTLRPLMTPYGDYPKHSRTINFFLFVNFTELS